MEAVSDFNFFMEKFNILTTIIYKVLTSKIRRSRTGKAAQALININSSYIDDVVLSTATNTDLLEGWI
jgi:hypothetical protein